VFEKSRGMSTCEAAAVPKKKSLNMRLVIAGLWSTMGSEQQRDVGTGGTGAGGKINRIKGDAADAQSRGEKRLGAMQSVGEPRRTNMWGWASLGE